jgi:hypothetical protein
MQKFFKSGTTVFPFEDMQAMAQSLEHASNCETGTFILFKSGHSIIHSSSRAEAQQLAAEFSVYLQASAKGLRR